MQVNAWEDSPLALLIVVQQYATRVRVGGEPSFADLRHQESLCVAGPTRRAVVQSIKPQRHLRRGDDLLCKILFSHILRGI